MIAIIDYGMGNLRSVQKAFEFMGFNAHITDNKKLLEEASHIVLPGVGAFADAIRSLNDSGACDAIKREIKKGKPFLGICLGMQLLFEKSFENGEHEGLGLIPGTVVPFAGERLKVPHMGWNSLLNCKSALLSGMGGSYAYFVHSYIAKGVPEENIAAWTDYSGRFPAAVNKENIYGLQFHPEKSDETGLLILRRFGGLKC